MAEIVDIDNKYSLNINGDIYSKKHNKTMKPFINKGGYLELKLYDNKSFTIHKLIARYFISNPNHYNVVNHIDGNKLNNNINNLEWCTPTENLLHAWRTGLNKGNSKNVNQYDLNMNFITNFKSAKDAERQTNISNGHINKVCHKIRKTAGGFIWCFGGDNI